MRNPLKHSVKLLLVLITFTIAGTFISDNCYAQSTFYRYYWLGSFLGISRPGTANYLDGDHSIQQLKMEAILLLLILPDHSQIALMFF